MKTYAKLPNGQELEVTIIHGERRKTFAGWFQIDELRYNDRKIGTIQHKSKGFSTSKANNGATVIGVDYDYLLREYILSLQKP